MQSILNGAVEIKDLEVFGHCLKCRNLFEETSLTPITLLEDAAEGDPVNKWDGVSYLCHKCYKKVTGKEPKVRTESVTEAINRHIHKTDDKQKV